MGSISPDSSAELAELDRMIHSALAVVLAEAKERNVLDPPYGRPPLQLPYEEYTREPPEGDEGDEDDEDDEFDENPVFKYEHGFNPLRVLAQYLRENNPNKQAVPPAAMEEEEAPAPAAAAAPAPAYDPLPPVNMS